MKNVNVVVEQNGYMLWRHNPLPDSVKSIDAAICEVEDADSEGVRKIVGHNPGITKLVLGYKNKPDRWILVGVKGPDIVSPKMTIHGPRTLTVGKKGQYIASLSGGKYDKAENYTWSCGASGYAGPNAVVDATGRPEGIIQVCCNVDIKATVDGKEVTRSVGGSIQIMIEEPD